MNYNDIWHRVDGNSPCCPDVEDATFIFGEGEMHSNAGGRRKACHAKGLTGKKFRDCLKGLRKEDKTKTRTEKKAAKKERKQEWKGVKKEIKTEWKKQGQRFYQRAWKSAAKVNPTFIIMRNAYLLLVKLNVWNMAASLAAIEKKAKEGDKKAQELWNKTKHKWEGFGGDFNSFSHQVSIGKGKKPIIIRFRKQSKFNGIEGWDIYVEEGGQQFSYVTGVEETVGAAATSTPIIVPIASIINSAATIISTTAPFLLNKNDEQNIQEAAHKQIENLPIKDDEKDTLNATINESIEEEDKIIGIPKTTFWIGASVLGAVVIGLTIWLTTKKK